MLGNRIGLMRIYLHLYLHIMYYRFQKTFYDVLFCSTDGLMDDEFNRCKSKKNERKDFNGGDGSQKWKNPRKKERENQCQQQPPCCGSTGTSTSTCLPIVGHNRECKINVRVVAAVMRKTAAVGRQYLQYLVPP